MFTETTQQNTTEGDINKTTILARWAGMTRPPAADVVRNIAVAPAGRDGQEARNEHPLLSPWHMLPAKKSPSQDLRAPRLVDPAPATQSVEESRPWVPRLRQHMALLEAPTYDVHREAASYGVHLNPNRLGRRPSDVEAPVSSGPSVLATVHPIRQAAGNLMVRCA